MRLWLIPHPWDYHEHGAYVVMAETAEEATAKVQAIPKGHAYAASKIEYDKIKELPDGIYADGGCDD